jgi:hypothetical protein
LYGGRFAVAPRGQLPHFELSSNPQRINEAAVDVLLATASRDPNAGI